MAEAPDGAPSMRLDRFLWFARLAKSRSLAQKIAEKGTLRIDGRRIERAHAPVRVGAIIAYPWNGGVRVLRVEALPGRRGPAAEAAALYTSLESPAFSAPASKNVDVPEAGA